MYIIVFFFKQKTAYEMRISDWSSDVCSSDLVLLRPEQLRLEATGDGPVARVRSVDFYGHDSRIWLELPDGITVSARLEGADLPTAGDDVAISVHGTEIGRASCRGRVCQYV